MADRLRATIGSSRRTRPEHGSGRRRGTGDLDKMLIKIADNYDSDVDVLVGSLISILEPVMVVSSV
jgi:hypothetical protein